jgi:hypothetical protein
MENLKIYVNQSREGYAFSLLRSQKSIVKSFFGEIANPASQVMVNYDLKSGFEKYYSKLEKYILPALLGIDDEKDLKRIQKISFIDPFTNNIIDTLIT